VGKVLPYHVLHPRAGNKRPFLLDLGPGDEVIVPSFTFVSTVNPPFLRGAKPVFIDVRSRHAEHGRNPTGAADHPKTKAVVPVHYAGVGCEMDAICEIAARHGVAVRRGQRHGAVRGNTRPHVGKRSGEWPPRAFTKPRTSPAAKGGALLLNDPAHVERAEIIREKGNEPSRFFRGQVDKYTWVDVGSSYLPSDILAAVLYAHWKDREAIPGGAEEDLGPVFRASARLGVKGGRATAVHFRALRAKPITCSYLLCPSLEKRTGADRAFENRCAIQSVFHYLPLHLAPMGRQFGAREGDCPVTESVSDRLLRLPFYNKLTEDDQQRVCDAIIEGTRSW